jgi:hypothetical protein
MSKKNFLSKSTHCSYMYEAILEKKLVIAWKNIYLPLSCGTQTQIYESRECLSIKIVDYVNIVSNEVAVFVR